MAANTDRSRLELRVADVRRSPPTGVRAKEHLAFLDGIDGSRRLIVQMDPQEARLLAVALTGDGASAVREAIGTGRLRSVGGTLRAGRITGVTDGRFASGAVLAGAGGTTTVALPLDHLLPQLVVAAAPLYADLAVLAAVQRSPVHRIGMATQWGWGEGTVGAGAIAADDAPPPAVAAEAPASPGSPPTSPRIQALGEKLAAGNVAALYAFWAHIAEEGTPLVEPAPAGGDEGGVLVTFLWRAVRPVGRVAVVRGLAGGRYSMNGYGRWSSIRFQPSGVSSVLTGSPPA